MGTTIDDSGKQLLLDLLAKEPTMVLSLAYIYAQNYVQYGEDITKAWTTAVQQASILEQVRQKAWVEAYDSFKKKYETRLKADMVAMLEDLKKKMNPIKASEYQIYGTECWNFVGRCQDVVQQKIDVLRGEADGKTGN